jgi:long-subunit acyl-CoA synthetase (AMP-forming)
MQELSVSAAYVVTPEDGRCRRHAGQVEEWRRTRGAGDLAEIVQPSGTTGRPKGCMLGHGNIVANTRNCMGDLLADRPGAGRHGRCRGRDADA